MRKEIASSSQLFIKSTTDIATGTTSDGVNTDVIADEDNDVTVEREAIANHMIRPITPNDTKVGLFYIGLNKSY